MFHATSLQLNTYPIVFWLDPTPEIAARYLGDGKTAVYLIRPDQHVAARWHRFNDAEVAAALARAIGKG